MRIKINIRKRLFLSNLLLILTISIICTSFILYTQNTLYNNGKWNITKMSLNRGVGDGVTYLVTSNALAKNNLNLGAWQGYQEVIYKDKISPSFIAFDVLLENPYEFSFIFNKDESGFSGIRININEKYGANEFFVSSSEGEFLNRTAIEINNIRYNKWNHFVAQFRNDKFILYVNQKIIGTYNLDLLKNQLIGFRGGNNKVLIDNVIISDNHLPKEITESFDNKKGFLLLFVVSFLILLILNLFILKLSKDKKYSYHFCLMINLTLLIILSLVYLYDYNIASEKYDPDFSKIDWKNYSVNVESEDSILTRIDNDYAKKEDNITRILFIGTSQTWGAGASKANKTFVSIFERLLNNNSQIVNYEVINGGVSGSKSERLLELYNNFWIKLRPEIVIIDLSYNDPCCKQFYNNLESFVSLNNLNNIKTVFILEPNANNDNDLRLKKYQVMRDIARENNIKVIDMHNFLLKHYSDGFLWWDFVHLSDFGQRLFAEELYAERGNIEK